MTKKERIDEFAHLPAAVGEYIRLVIKKMGYRKCVREDVKKELIHHFEDALKDCKDKQQSERLALKLIENFGEPKILGKLMKRAKKRCRPLWRTMVVRVLQAVGLFILAIIGYCILITFAKPNITTDYVEKMNNLARPVADESLNAAHDYRKAFEAYKPDPNLGKLISDKENIKDFNEAELAAVRKWVADNNTAIDYYLKASQKPYCWWNRKLDDPNYGLWGVLLPELAELRKISRLLLISAQLDAKNGNITATFDKINSCFKSGLHLKGPRTLVEQLVGMAIQALSDQTTINIIKEVEINSDELKKIQVKLEGTLDNRSSLIYLDVEKFFTYDYMQRLFTDESLFGGRPIPLNMTAAIIAGPRNHLNVFELYGLSLVSASRAELAQFTNDYYDKFDELSKLTPYNSREKIAELDNKLNSLTGIKSVRYWLPRALFPALGKVIQISYRNKISNEATICIIALYRYKLDKGGYPDTLGQLLQAGYIKSVPMDPFSDKQVVYKKTGDDFILYSVGFNYTDDSGTLGKDNNGKFRQWSDNGDAVFWPVQ